MNRRVTLASLFVLLFFASVKTSHAQTTTYHLHKEASSTAGLF